MARSKNGEAISEFRRTGSELAALDALLISAEAAGDLNTWRRARALRRYIDGKKVTALMEELGVKRSTINTWLRWYETEGVEGLKTLKAAGAAPRLSVAQREERTSLKDNPELIELHRLPAYSPEFNPTEGVWKVTRKMTTHNRFFRTVEDRDAALTRTFETFQRQPELIAGHVRRFQ